MSSIRPARTVTYEHTITGILTKRADLYNEAERIRDRLAEIRNDIDALDRVLGTLGYEGDLEQIRFTLHRIQRLQSSWHILPV